MITTRLIVEIETNEPHDKEVLQDLIKRAIEGGLYDIAECDGEDDGPSFTDYIDPDAGLAKAIVNLHVLTT